MIASMTFRKDRMEASAKNGFTNATDAADYLVNQVLLSVMHTALLVSLFYFALIKIAHLMSFLLMHIVPSAQYLMRYL